MQLQATSFSDPFRVSSLVAFPEEQKKLILDHITHGRPALPSNDNFWALSPTENISASSLWSQMIGSLETLVDRLNQIGAQLLSAFDRLGTWQGENNEDTDPLGQLSGVLPNVSTGPTEGQGITSPEIGQGNLAIPVDPGISNVGQSAEEVSPANMGISFFKLLRSLMNALTGILSAARSFHADTQNGDTSYQGTMKNIFSTILKLSAGSAVGTLAGIAVSALSGGTLLPVVLGTSAGLGTSALLSRLLNPFNSSGVIGA